MSVFFNSQIKEVLVDLVPESNLIDVFGRLRVSEPTDLYTNKNVYNIDGINMKEKVEGNATITYGGTNSAMELNVTSANGDKAVRQSRYIPYVPSKSQLITMTGVLSDGNSSANLYHELGQFDDNNGLFFRENNGVFSVVKRSNVSGTPVDIEVAQDNFNIDKLDGTGASGKTIDVTKTLIFKINYQWLGVGIAIMSVVLDDGQEYMMHAFKHSNIETDVYMESPNLPIRYQIYNDGVSTVSSTLKEICCSAVSEGAFELTGRGYCEGMGTNAITANTTEQFIFALRLKDTYTGKPNRVLNRLLSANFYSESETALFKMYKYFDPSAITATWTDVGNASACEYSTDLSAITSTYNPCITNKYIAASSQGSKNAPQSSETGLSTSNELTILCQNFDSTNSDVFVVTAQTIASTSDVLCSLSWIENF